jgi:uncharacterized protein (TIGR03437 family)
MSRTYKRLLLVAIPLFLLGTSAIAQEAEPFVFPPFGGTQSERDNEDPPSAIGVILFGRRIDGSYVNFTYDTSSPHALLANMAALSDLLSGGLAKLMAAPAGPANTGPASQMFAWGKFTADGLPGAAYTTSNNSSLVNVALGSISLLYTGAIPYSVGPTTTGVVAADFNGDGVLDLAVPYLGNGAPGGVGILINKGDGTFNPAVSYMAGASPISVAALDFNHDGILDLAVADNGSSSVYVLLGNGNGTFKPAVAYPAGLNSLSITAADFDGDGIPDIASTAEDGSVTILFGNGNGTFRAGSSFKTVSATPFYIAAADLNRDGRADLVTADGYAGSVTVFLNTGRGAFQRGSSYAVSPDPNSLVIADYTGDGKPDVIVGSGDARLFWGSENSGKVDFLPGNGDGTLQALALTNTGSPNPVFLAIADFNGDGVPDAAIKGGSNSVLLFAGSKTGVFKPPVTISTGQLTPAGAVAGDFNGDGKPDLAVTDASGAVGVMLNSASGLQAPSTFSSGGAGAHAIATADFDGDGKLDLAVTNVASGKTVIFRGVGNGAFQPLQTYSTGVYPANIIAADVNGDGRPDLIVLDSGTSFSSPPASGAVYVLINSGGGNFQAPVRYTASNYPIAVAAADVNGDGRPDLIVATQDSSFAYHLAILLNNGGGGFGPAALIDTEFGPNSLAVRDFNGDGKADIVVAHCCGDTNMTYLQGAGDGTFSAEVDFIGGPSPDLVQVADLNGDGLPDLVVAGGGNGISAAAIAGMLNTGPQAAPPTVAVTSVVNGASGASGAISPGEMVTIRGNGLGPANGVSYSLDPDTGGVDTTLGGTQVFFGTFAAPITYASASKITAIVPYEIAGQSTVVAQVQYLGAQSAGVSLPVATAAPGVFTNDSTGSGEAVAANQDGSLNDPSNPAPAGSYVTIYFTGGGQTDPPGVTGSVSGEDLKSFTQSVSVTVGGVPAMVVFGGAAPDLLDGVNELSIQLDANTPSGPAEPIMITIGGISSSATATLAVQ